MPDKNGAYSTADVRNKIMGAAMLLSKGSGKFQNAVYLILDAAGMLDKMARAQGLELRMEDSGQAPVLIPESPYSKSKIGERLATAIGRTDNGHWQDAVHWLFDALVMLQDSAAAHGRTLVMTQTPVPQNNEAVAKEAVAKYAAWIQQRTEAVKERYGRR